MGHTHGLGLGVRSQGGKQGADAGCMVHVWLLMKEQGEEGRGLLGITTCREAAPSTLQVEEEARSRGNHGRSTGGLHCILQMREFHIMKHRLETAVDQLEALISLDKAHVSAWQPWMEGE